MMLRTTALVTVLAFLVASAGAFNT
ncbi:unnamed protein product, partial [Cercopithifilaria johnstoni]